MSKRIENTKAFLHSLAHSSPKRRRLILNNATKAELEGLFEVCLNVLKGYLPLDPRTFNQFRRQRKTIETLGNRQVSIKTKKKLINQKGGFLGKLALFALPLITDIASRLIKK